MKTRLQRKLSQSHSQFHPRTNLIFFLLLFFCSIVLTNICFSDEAFRLGFQLENLLKQYQMPSMRLVSFAGWLMRNRFTGWLLLLVIGYFYRSNTLYIAVTGWFGFSAGFFVTTLIRHFGLRCFPLLFGIFLPHFVLYLLAYTLLIKNTIHRTRAYLVKCVLMTAVYMGGCLCEYYCNSWLLQKIYHLTTLLT